MKSIVIHSNHLLAAEYVLGTLRGKARRRYQTYLQKYQQLNQAVEQWQLDLSELTDTIPGVKPPSTLWANIKNKL